MNIMESFVNKHEIKKTERQSIYVAEDSSGKKYLIREINGDKREIYKTLQKINHTNFPRIHSVEFDGNTRVVEEYVSGESLSEIMARGIKIDKKFVRTVVRQLLDIMEKLHESKIIHRDIKPDNILVDKSNHVWLIDYDIARIYRDEVRKDTESMGTFGYAPIEQYGVLPTDFRTDIYAFGITLQSLLNYSKTGGVLKRIADKCKRLDPSQRYKSATDIKKTIRRKRITAISIIFTAIVAVIAGTTYWFDNYYVPNGYVAIDEEMSQAIRFYDFEITESVLKYHTYEGYDSLTIFGADSASSHLLFIEDSRMQGQIALGRHNGTMIDADIDLKDGVLSMKLADPYGYTFVHEFEYDPKHEYDLLYTENRRQNADIICWDVDGDGVEELLVGVNDVTFRVDGERILSYMNYCLGWCIRYNEALGFQLCEGDMFNAGTKFGLNKGKIGVYLQYGSATMQNKGIISYNLYNDNTIRPVYE